MDLYNLPNIKDGAVVLLIARRGEGKSTLISNLMLNPNMLHKENFDYVFYIAGVDIHFNDRLGKLKISLARFSRYKKTSNSIELE